MTMTRWCAIVALLLMGCASSVLHGRHLSWDEVQRFADIDIRTPTRNGPELHFPIVMHGKTGDSVSVLVLAGTVSDDKILVRGVRESVDVVPNREQGGIDVRLPDSPLSTYQLIYVDPDGHETQIGVVNP